MSKLITPVLEVASAVAITVGAAAVWGPFGWIVGGGLGLWFARSLA